MQVLWPEMYAGFTGELVLMENTIVKLKRCPFCDGTPEIRHGGLAFMASVSCPGCGAEIKVINEDANKAVIEAVKKWNKRKGK